MSEGATSVFDHSPKYSVDATSLAAAATGIGWKDEPTEEELVAASPLDPKKPIFLAYAWHIICELMEGSLSVQQTMSLSAFQEHVLPQSWAERDKTVLGFRLRFRKFAEENIELFRLVNGACRMRFLGAYSAISMKLSAHMEDIMIHLEWPYRRRIPAIEKHQAEASRLFAKSMWKKRRKSQDHLYAASQDWMDSFSTQASEILQQRAEGLSSLGDATLALATWNLAVEWQGEAVQDCTSHCTDAPDSGQRALVTVGRDNESLIRQSIARAAILQNNFRGRLAELEFARAASSITHNRDVAMSDESAQTSSTFSLPMVGPRP
jgi:hypothetical protein